MTLCILFRDGTLLEFNEKDMHDQRLTIKGYADEIVCAWRQRGGSYALDKYTMIQLDEVMAVYVRA